MLSFLLKPNMPFSILRHQYTNEFIKSLNIKRELPSIYEFEVFLKKIYEIKTSIIETILLSTAISIQIYT